MNLFQSKFGKIAGIATLVGGLALTSGVVATYAQDATSTGTPSAVEEGERPSRSQRGFGNGFGRFFGESRGGPLADIIDPDVMKAKMAEILGISVEQLDAAKDEGKRLPDLVEELGLNMDEVKAKMDAAKAELIQQAVTDGTITQEQADRILSREGRRGGHGRHGRHGGRHGGRGGERGGILGGIFNRDSMLGAIAGQLGLSTEQLDDAMNNARTQLVQQAVTAGTITQEQADRILSREGRDFFGHGGRGGRGGRHGGERGGILRNVVDRAEMKNMVAATLGMTVEELDAARDADKTLADLLTEKNMTAEQFETALEAKLTAAIAQAVTDGTITQAQADSMTSWLAEHDVSRMFDRGAGRGDRGPKDKAAPETGTEDGNSDDTNESGSAGSDRDSSASAADAQTADVQTDAFIPLVVSNQ